MNSWYIFLGKVALKKKKKTVKNKVIIFYFSLLQILLCKFFWKWAQTLICSALHWCDIHTLDSFHNVNPSPTISQHQSSTPANCVYLFVKHTMLIFIPNSLFLLFLWPGMPFFLFSLLCLLSKSYPHFRAHPNVLQPLKPLLILPTTLPHRTRTIFFIQTTK